jgi:nicotinate-nucleotide pyrophosphorylase (carboxylating)
VLDAKEKLGYLHKISVYVSSETDLKSAVTSGADVVILDGFTASDVSRLVKVAKEISSTIAIECSGAITLENVREYAETGADLIHVEALTNSAPAKNISFQVQPY